MIAISNSRVNYALTTRMLSGLFLLVPAAGSLGIAYVLLNVKHLSVADFSTMIYTYLFLAMAGMLLANTSRRYAQQSETCLEAPVYWAEHHYVCLIAYLGCNLIWSVALLVSGVIYTVIIATLIIDMRTIPSLVFGVFLLFLGTNLTASVMISSIITFTREWRAVSRLTNPAEQPQAV